jgi:hypothetical protein
MLAALATGALVIGALASGCAIAVADVTGGTGSAV